MLECQAIKSKTNGKCAEAKALTRALKTLKSEGKGVEALRGSLSVAVEVRLPGKDLHHSIKNPCSPNCEPALSKLGIDWVKPEDVK